MKRRILSGLGHLSNEQKRKILERLENSNVTTVVLGHLSQHNNTKQLAYQSASSVLESMGKTIGKDVYLYVADQEKNGVIL